MKKIYREIPPLNPQEIFGIFNYPDADFDCPLHNHPEYEITLTLNAAGNRVVGDKIEKYAGKDLVLLGPYINHVWDDTDTDRNKYPHSQIIVLQFEEDLFKNSFLSKSAFHAINVMLSYSVRGIEFLGETLRVAQERIFELLELKGIEAAFGFLKLLDFLANSKEHRLITSAGYSTQIASPESKRIDKVYKYIRNNYHKKITSQQIAHMINLSESAFSHLFKKSTHRSFNRFLTEVRLGEACKRLLGSNDSVGEICAQCGYSNLSNFNRLFKKYKGKTPLEYRYQVSFDLPKDTKRFI